LFRETQQQEINLSPVKEQDIEEKKPSQASTPDGVATAGATE
jgi:hypothetical protein